MAEMIDSSLKKSVLTTASNEDLLDRCKIAKNFLKVVKVQTSNVYSINAPWGSGKTWFLKFIEEECNEQNIPFIQFNAWKTDYAKDPFQAILCELLELLHQQIKNIKTKNEIEKLKQELDAVKENANKFINLRKRLALSISVNPPLSPISGELTINPDNSSLAEYMEMKELKNSFIHDLTDFVNSFDTKLIIAIDELDRCRPDYTITVLEIIKHFFDIKNIVFILAVDKAQLHCTIKAMFGSTTNVDAYLKKFVDIQYTLPQSSNDKFIRYLIESKYPLIKQSIEKLSNKNKILRFYTTSDIDVWSLYLYETNEDIADINNICKSINLSLRDIDKLCLKLNIILPQLAKQESILQLDFLIRLIIINIQNPKLYNQLRNLQEIPFAQNKINDYLVGSLFKNVYEMLCNINTNPRVAYYVNEETKDLASSYKSIKSYFDKIDFVENFS